MIRKPGLYFKGRQFIVKKNYSVKQVLKNPNLTGRLVAWSMELSEYDISFIPRSNLKS